MKSMSLMARAITYLSRREYSRYELKQKLTPHAPSEQELEHVLDQLRSLNYQSDERFLEGFVRSKSHWGRHKILYALSQYHLDPLLIETIKDSLKDQEFDHAFEVWEKRFKGQLPQDSKQYMTQARFLASRGFDHSVIHQILKMTFQEVLDKIE